jgi:hypothetical protein
MVSAVYRGILAPHKIVFNCLSIATILKLMVPTKVLTLAVVCGLVDSELRNDEPY